MIPVLLLRFRWHVLRLRVPALLPLLLPWRSERLEPQLLQLPSHVAVAPPLRVWISQFPLHLLALSSVRLLNSTPWRVHQQTTSSLPAITVSPQLFLPDGSGVRQGLLV